MTDDATVIAATPTASQQDDLVLNDVYEFYGPFAHIEGRYEWCRIRSPTHGAFDCFIVLGKTTSHPATVYVNDEIGQRFMFDRYPESSCIRVPADALALNEEDGGRTVHGTLESTQGPARAVDLRFLRKQDSIPEQVSYGDGKSSIWGSKKYACQGVDLNLQATVTGFVVDDKGREERFDAQPSIITLGSFGRIHPLPAND